MDTIIDRIEIRELENRELSMAPVLFSNIFFNLNPGQCEYFRTFVSGETVDHFYTILCISLSFCWSKD